MAWYPCAPCCRRKPPDPCLILEDDFNRADNPDPGPDWVEISGTWSIVSNELQGDSTAAEASIRTDPSIDPVDPHHYISVKVRPLTFDVLEGWTEVYITYFTGWLGCRLRFQAANRVTIELLDQAQNQIAFGEAQYTLGEQQTVVLCVNDNSPTDSSTISVRVDTDLAETETLFYTFPGTASPGTIDSLKFTVNGVANFDDVLWSLNSENTIGAQNCPPCPTAPAPECEACMADAPGQFTVGVEDATQGDCEPCDTLLPLDLSQDANNKCLYTGSYNYGGAGLCGDPEDEEELTISGSLLLTKNSEVSYQIDYTYTLSTNLGRTQTATFQHSQSTPYDCLALLNLTLTLQNVTGDALCDFITAPEATATVTTV